MKRLHAWITGGLLTASIVAAQPVLANEDHARYSNGRYNGASATVTNGTYENGMYYVTVNGERMAWPAGAVMINEPGGMFVSRNGQIYYVHDNPQYDLSGAGKTIILVEDGSTFQAQSWNTPVALARAGGASKEVVTLPAEYRQHWLAVAAGDRPVRNLTSVPASPKGPTMTFVPVVFARDRARMDEERTASYTNGTKAKRTGTVKKTSVRKTSRHRKSSATVASRNGYRTNGYRANGYRANGYRANGYRTNGYRANGATAYTADTSARTRVGETFDRMPEETRNLYQVGSSWYQRDGDSWSRSDSWRGPFVAISSGMVPREVKMSQKEPFRD